MASRKRDRLYWREGRAWADFRDYADVGGGREALKAPGTKQATSDEDLARVLLGRRLEVLDGKRRGRVIHGEQKEASLAGVARLDLIAKADSKKPTAEHLTELERRIRTTLAFLGGPTDPDARLLDPNTIGVTQVRALVAHLRTLPNGRGSTMSEGSVRHYLNAL